MKKKNVAFMAIGAIFAVTLLASNVATVSAVSNGFTDIVKATVREVTVFHENPAKSDNFMKFVAKANGHIPVDGISGAFGYGFLLDGTTQAVVIVTHNGIDDTTYALPQHGFHGHVLNLVSPPENSFCAGEAAPLQVDIGTSVALPGFGVEYPVEINGKKIKMFDVDAQHVTDLHLDLAVMFTASGQVSGNAGDPFGANTPTDICVFPQDSIGPPP